MFILPQISDNLVSSSKYCGSDPPQMYIAANRYVFIFFESDGNHTGKGFTAIYANKGNILYFLNIGTKENI